MTGARSSCLVALVAASSACGSRTPEPPRVPPAVPAAAPSVAQYEAAVGTMFQLATGGPLAEAERRKIAARLANGTQSIADYAKDLSERAESLRYAPIVLFPWESQRTAVGLVRGLHVLAAVRDSDHDVFHIDGRPACDPKLATKVQPWWAPSSEVFICPDDYRPTVLRTRTGYVCPNADLECPCGPNLMACAPKDVFDKVQHGMAAEFDDTIVARISEKAKLADLFKGSDTVRDRYAEWIYQRAEVQRGAPAAELLHINDWPEQPTRAPRPELGPGMSSGILTTPHIQSMLYDPREEMQVMSDVLWCLEPRSVHVRAEKVLELPVEFRSLDGWAQLAHMPVCDGCHARLDYGAQFWLFWKSGGRYDANAHPQPDMTLYMNDMRDQRGTGPATPAGFAELAVAQPEFGRCMSKRVVEHFIGRTYEPADIEAVAAEYRRVGTYQALTSAALLRLADRLLAPQATAAEPAPTLRLAQLLDDKCASLCHSGPQAPLGVRFDVTPIDRARLARALENVAFGRMPPAADEPLSAAQRREIVQQLVQELWSDPGSRAVALQYFDREMNNVNSQRPDAILRLIRARVGLETSSANTRTIDPYYLLSTRDKLEYTPEMALDTVLSGLDACKEAGTPTRDCVANATALDGIVGSE